MRNKTEIIILCVVLFLIPLALKLCVQAETTEEKYSSVKILCEVPELREKNADTFLLSDGGYECVLYLDNKYYDDGTGKLVPIDNAIIDTCYMDGRKEYHYRNAANESIVYFEENYPSVLITYEGRKLSFTYAGEKMTYAQSGGLKNREMISDYTLKGENFLAYPEVETQTDLVYAVYNGNVKEYIVLNNSEAPIEFTFCFDTEGYFVRKTDLERIGFFNEKGEMAFELGSLFAVDNAGKYTDKVSYELKDYDGESSRISVKLSEEYANDPDRVYPILIDPSVMITGADVTYDTFVSSRYPNTNYFNDNHLRTGWDEDLYTRRSYMRFQLPNNISANSVDSAFIRINQYIGTSPNMKAYRVIGNWVSGQLTWNNKPGYTTVGASSTAVQYSDGWYFTYITDMVKGWLNGTYSEYGFVLKDATESSVGPWSTFYSSEAASPNKPELHIRYNEGLSSAPEFLFWNSDDNSISKWTITPKITKITLSDFEFPQNEISFNTTYFDAVNDWISAGIPININALSGYNIECIGGTLSELLEQYGEDEFESSIHGVTVSWTVITGHIIYGSQTKIRKVFSTSNNNICRVYILKTWENTNFPTHLTQTFLHELGHALGWIGHSPNNLDIMYNNPYYPSSLSDGDILFLLQYYNANENKEGIHNEK